MIVALLLLVLLVACTGTPSSTEGTTGASTSSLGSGGEGAATSAGGAGGSGAGPFGGAPPAGLVDRGLVARYFIDEAASGTEPTQLSDAADDPLPLAVHYDGTVAFGERDGQRGLIFAVVGAFGRASVPIGGTKVLSRLVGKTTSTLEAVVALDAVSTTPTRILHIGADTDSGKLTMSAPLLDRIYLHSGDGRAGAWVASVGPTRVVLHVVLDTNAAPELRVRGYANGSPLPRFGGEIPEAGAAIVLDGDEHLVVGNREVGERSPEGAVLYAAIYDESLTEAEVLRNASLLLASDDQPPTSARQSP